MRQPGVAPLQAAIAAARFGLGARPGELQAAAGDPRGWLLAQIRPEGADQPDAPLSGSTQVLAELVGYRNQLQALRRGFAGGAPGSGQGGMPPGGFPGGPAMAPVVAQAAQPGSDDAAAARARQAERRAMLRPLQAGTGAEILARTALAARTTASFRERWALFWANHFTVSASKLQAGVLAGPFEREAIRPGVFGRFPDLLMAAVAHPGMLVYLDQARSAGPNSQAAMRRNVGLNENLAREILELHTVGADAGYAQADVTEFARALTGYSIGGERDPPDAQGRFLFRPAMHEPGSRIVMGRRYPDGGAEQAGAILADLAAHPRTAEHLARKIAAHFVADVPPPSLVVRLRDAWQRSRGDLAAVAAALVRSPEAWDPQPRKIKTPNEFLVSAYRAVDAVPSDPAREVVGPLTALGQRPFGAPQPNGWSDLGSSWAAPDAVVKRLAWSIRFAEAQAARLGAPVEVAEAALGERLSPAVRAAVLRAETRSEAFALFLMSPEFQRR